MAVLLHDGALAGVAVAVTLAHHRAVVLMSVLDAVRVIELAVLVAASVRRTSPRPSSRGTPGNGAWDAGPPPAKHRGAVVGTAAQWLGACAIAASGGALLVCAGFCC
ncbi:hypothetical protein ABS772_05785, partial [Methylorubrum podarium]